MPKITKRPVDALKPGDKADWDSDVKGFGVRVSSKGSTPYVVAYRPHPGGRGVPKRWYAIGTHGTPWTVDKARTEAKSILGRVADGEDPQAEHMAERRHAGTSITELVPSYIKAKKRQRSWREVARLVSKHLVPVLATGRTS